MAQKMKPRKALRVPLLKMCKSTCCAVTNLELTSSRILSLLSLNSNTSIASAATLQMLSKQTNSTQFTFLLKSAARTGQNSVYGGILQVYGNVNRTAREEVIHSKSSGLHFALRVGRSTLRSFSNQYFNTA